MTDRPRRAAIYARFSSDLQEARSVTDQVAMCRDHAKRNGWTVVQVYADEAISGASVHGRASLARLVDDANHRAFDVILLEHIDRLSRRPTPSGCANRWTSSELRFTPAPPVS